MVAVLCATGMSLYSGVCSAAQILQALNLFRRKTGRNDFFEVKLDKHVPHGEGSQRGGGVICAGCT